MVRLKTVGGSTNWLQPYLMANSIIADSNKSIAGALASGGTGIGEALVHKKDKAQQQRQFDASQAQADSHFQQSLAETRANRADMKAERAADDARDWDKFNAHLMAGMLKDSDAKATALEAAAEGDETVGIPGDPNAKVAAAKARTEAESIRSSLLSIQSRNGRPQAGTSQAPAMPGNEWIDPEHTKARLTSDGATVPAPKPSAPFTPPPKVCVGDTCDVSEAKAPVISAAEYEKRAQIATARSTHFFTKGDAVNGKKFADAALLNTGQANAAKQGEKEAEEKRISGTKVAQGVTAYKALKSTLGFNLTPEEDAAAMGAVAAGRDPREMVEQMGKKRGEFAALRTMIGDQAIDAGTMNAITAAINGGKSAKAAFDEAFPGEMGVRRSEARQGAEREGRIDTATSRLSPEAFGVRAADREKAKIDREKENGTYVAKDDPMAKKDRVYHVTLSRNAEAKLSNYEQLHKMDDPKKLAADPTYVSLVQAADEARNGLADFDKKAATPAPAAASDFNAIDAAVRKEMQGKSESEIRAEVLRRLKGK